ncbi:MAG: GAF domain-containing protein [Desulfobacteraceae bacterium]|nr:MAG: GAF domain-containing protein [Desulfobacteraceae bacterium]
MFLIVSKRLNLELSSEIEKGTLLLRQTLRQKELLNTIENIQTLFIREEDQQNVFDTMLLEVLRLTRSQYGFIDSLEHDDVGDPFLQALSITNIAWDKDSREFYGKMAPSGLRFFDFNALFGPAVKNGEVVISNHDPVDPRRKGTPEGHPPINTFLAIPLRHEGTVIGVVALANRDEGYDEKLVKELESIWVSCAQLVNAYKSKAQKIETERELKDYADTQTTLIREINHRVKNNLAIIIGLIHREIDSTTPADSLARDLLQRMLLKIEGLDTVHRMLSDNYWKPILISELCRGILESMQCTLEQDDLSVDIKPSNIKVTSTQAYYMAIIINELATNTLKHATRTGCGVEISFSAYLEKNHVVIDFKDNGDGFPQSMLHEGILSDSHGLGLVKGPVEHSLQGELSLQNDNGAMTTIKFKHS